MSPSPGAAGAPAVERLDEGKTGEHELRAAIPDVSQNNRRARFCELTAAGRKQLAAEQAEFDRMLTDLMRLPHHQDSLDRGRQRVDVAACREPGAGPEILRPDAGENAGVHARRHPVSRRRHRRNHRRVSIADVYAESGSRFGDDLRGHEVACAPGHIGAPKIPGPAPTAPAKGPHKNKLFKMFLAHICAIHHVGDDHGLPFIVMEYVDGEPLHERLQSGPLSCALGDSRCAGSPAMCADAVGRSQGRIRGIPLTATRNRAFIAPIVPAAP